MQKTIQTINPKCKNCNNWVNLVKLPVNTGICVKDQIDIPEGVYNASTGEFSKTIFPFQPNLEILPVTRENHVCRFYAEQLAETTTKARLGGYIQRLAEMCKTQPINN